MQEAAQREIDAAQAVIAGVGDDEAPEAVDGDAAGVRQPGARGEAAVAAEAGLSGAGDG